MRGRTLTRKISHGQAHEYLTKIHAHAHACKYVISLFHHMTYLLQVTHWEFNSPILQWKANQSAGITSNGKIKFYQSHKKGYSFYGKIWSEGSEEPAEYNWVGKMIQSPASQPAPYGYISVMNRVYYLNVGKAVFSSLHAFEKTVKVLQKLDDAIKSGKANEYIDMLRGK